MGQGVEELVVGDQGTGDQPHSLALGDVLKPPSSPREPVIEVLEGR